MKNSEFDLLSMEIDARATRSMLEKGADYPPDDDDRLSNFKATGALVRLILGNRTVSPADPALIATVFLAKHLIPLVKFAFGEGGESEPIVGRAGDAINYIKLLVAIGVERREGGQEPAGNYMDGLDLVREHRTEEDLEVENTSGPLSTPTR